MKEWEIGNQWWLYQAYTVKSKDIFSSAEIMLVEDDSALSLSEICK